MDEKLLEFFNGISNDEFWEMIKRNTPLKVDGIEDDGWCGWRAVCPECRGSVVSVDAYCVYCGQKLDWGELNEND
jgi:hypothetical protein